MQISDRADAGRAKATQREAEHNTEQGDANGIVPVIQLEGPAFFARQLLGICPGAPSDHRDNATQDSYTRRAYGEHLPILHGAEVCVSLAGSRAGLFSRWENNFSLEVA